MIVFDKLWTVMQAQDVSTLFQIQERLWHYDLYR